MNDEGAVLVPEQPSPFTVIVLPSSSIWVIRTPLELRIGLLQVKGAIGVQKLDDDAPPMRNIPNKDSVKMTMEMTRIVQPYVMRYSIADCAFPLLDFLEGRSARLMSCMHS